MAEKPSLISRASEIFTAVLVAVALAGIQVLIGGTRLVFLPIYTLLGLAGLLAVFSLRRLKPAPGRICLLASALFFGYILIRAWFSPVHYLARTDIFSVVGGLVINLAVAFIFTSARGAWRFFFSSSSSRWCKWGSAQFNFGAGIISCSSFAALAAYSHTEILSDITLREYARNRYYLGLNATF